MFKILDDSYGKNLWEMYLESIRPEHGDQITWPSAAPPLAEAVSADPLQFTPERVFGNVRLLSDSDFLILYMVIAQIAEDRFTALKVSNFKQFGTYFDLEFPGANGSYIAELDNAFTLSREQILGSVVLDETDAYTFGQLEGAWLAEGNRFSGKPLYWENIGRWRAQFRIKEHELTCAYRIPSVNSLTASLWIPQLELQKEPLVMRMYQKSCLDVSRSIPSLDLEKRVSKDASFSRDDLDDAQLRAGKREYDSRPSLAGKMFRAAEAWYKLTKSPGGWELELAPDLEGNQARIYNGEYLIFKGILPPFLKLDRYAHLSKHEIENALELRLESQHPY
ncbi:MAG: hypothetical protein LHW57_01610 [Candidatus Cloacimonetes bacterium]|nr:hypothetical protein [Candidatus Cloacimonadota bacterium]